MWHVSDFLTKAMLWFLFFPSNFSTPIHFETGISITTEEHMLLWNAPDGNKKFWDSKRFFLFLSAVTISNQIRFTLLVLRKLNYDGKSWQNYGERCQAPKILKLSKVPKIKILSIKVIKGAKTVTGLAENVRSRKCNSYYEIELFTESYKGTNSLGMLGQLVGMFWCCPKMLPQHRIFALWAHIHC